jgi:predicted SprT family Zn-dependent metalloprotease
MEQKRNESDLQPILIKCISILNNIGYKNINISGIKLNGRLRTTYGRYNAIDKTIQLNKLHFLYSDQFEVERTIIHELTHHIDASSYKSLSDYLTHHCNNGHTKEWWNIANDVTYKTGYKIEQYNEYNLDDILV